MSKMGQLVLEIMEREARVDNLPQEVPEPYYEPPREEAPVIDYSDNLPF